MQASHVWRLSLTVVFITVTATVHGQNNLQQLQIAAREAYHLKEYGKFYERIIQAHELHPYHQGILYQAGIAAALTGKQNDALKFLRQAIQIKADFDLGTEDLKSLSSLEEFQKLKKLQGDLLKRAITSDTAFVIRQKNLHIEALAVGEAEDIFYLASIHKRKILRSNSRGMVKDFTSSGQDGLTSVFGIKVDQKRKILWACASPLPVMENYDSTATAGIFQYDLKTGKLLAKYKPNDNREYAFGDIILDYKGKVYISDSKNNTIFTIDEQSNKLIEYYKSDAFWNIQGITFSEDGNFLFIADYVKGIFRLNTSDKSLIQLSATFDSSLKSIDGLSFYKNSLIAIQNMVVPMRSAIIKLNSSMDTLVSYDVIDRAHPAFNEPTNGCITGGYFYYVANSLWSGYTRDNKLKPEHELQDVVILKYKLR